MSAIKQRSPYGLLGSAWGLTACALLCGAAVRRRECSIVRRCRVENSPYTHKLGNPKSGERHLHALDEAVPVALAQQPAHELARLKCLELVHVLACAIKPNTLLFAVTQARRWSADSMRSPGCADNRLELAPVLAVA